MTRDTTKQYDRAYFDKWYRSWDNKVSTAAEVRRKVAMAVSISEYFLRRPLRSVLDIGCGEAAWLPHLRSMRQRIAYQGLDPSDYVVSRFGKSRNIRKASFADLPQLDLGTTYDLVICSDVLHYVDEASIPAGIAAINRFAHGAAYIEVLTKEDDVIGDLDGLEQRPAAYYRKLLTKAGFVGVGPYTWLSPAISDIAAQLEMPR